MPRLFVALLALASCGRIDFAPRSDAGITGDAYDPGLFVAIALPPGGQAESIAIGTTAGEAYVSFANRGLFHTTDSGLSWTECGPLRGRFAASTTDGVVYSLAGDIYASDDRCAHWRPTNAGFSTRYIVARGSTVYAAASDGLYAYSGGSWSRMSSPLDGSSVTTVDLQGSTIVIGSRTGIAYSTNGGASWTTSTAGLGNFNIASVAIAPSLPTRVYAIEGTSGADTGGLFRSNDSGATWLRLFDNGGSNVAIDPVDPDHFLFANYNTLFGATDGANLVDVRSAAMESSNPQWSTFDGAGGSFVASMRGVYYRQGNASFAPRIGDISAWQIVRSSYSATGVFWATGAGLLSSQDAGTTFKLISNIGLSSGIVAAVLLPSDSANVFAAQRFVGRSTDNGASFSNVYDSGSVNGYGIHQLAALSTNRLVAVSRTQVTFADPPWTTWTNVIVDGVSQGCYEAAVIAGDEVSITCDLGTYHSTDGAQTFQLISSPPDGAPRRLVAGPQGFVGGTSDGLWVLDAGAWQRRGLDGLTINAVLFADATWVAAADTGVYVSHDSGTTWKRLAGLSDRTPMALARAGSGDLLVGTAGHGMFRSPFP